MKPKGFNVNGGYMGMLPNGRYQLFDTEKEYLNYIKEEEDNERRKKPGKGNSNDNESKRADVQE